MTSESTPEFATNVYGRMELLNHSYGASQVEWFKRGSALNLFHPSP